MNKLALLCIGMHTLCAPVMLKPTPSGTINNGHSSIPTPQTKQPQPQNPFDNQKYSIIFERLLPPNSAYKPLSPNTENLTSN